MRTHCCHLPHTEPRNLANWGWLALAVALGAHTAACGGDSAETPAETSDAGGADDGSSEPAQDGSADTTPRPPFRAANSLSDDDPRKAGEWHFIYNTWGTAVDTTLPPADFLLELMETEPEVFGNQFENFGFVPDPSSDFPIGLSFDAPGSNAVTETCGLCHVAELPDGRIWIGAPNEALQWGAFRVAVDDRWVAAGNPSRLDPLDREKILQMGPGRTNAESGSYPRLVPANFPVYFRLGQRNALNYMGTGQNTRTESYFALYALGCENPNPEEALIPWPDEQSLTDLVAYVSAIEPPDAPPVDETLRARGEEVFAEARCNTCHFPADQSQEFVVPLDREGSGLERYPGDDPEWPRGSIRTSTAHRILQDGDENGQSVDGGIENYLTFILSKGIQVRQTDGYRTNSLLGLWASAPYLHNGSVPTLEDLLRPAAERPVTWQQGDFTVDTRVFGFDNRGHEFGTELSEDDREALIVYLRSL